MRAWATSWLPLAAAATCALLVAEALTGRRSDLLELLLLTVLAFPAGRARTRPAGLVTIALLLGGVSAYQLISSDIDEIVPQIMLPLTLYSAGLALRSRELLAERLAHQADELAAERDAYSQLSIRYERARIAAELHDVVAHAISMMVVQASAGQRLAEHDPTRIPETFSVIATAARQAQGDLDRLAELLATDGTVEAHADLRLMSEIVDTARASGLPVTLRVSGDTSVVSGAAAHTALRVVQEGLTNALRYAPGADVSVALDIRPGAIELAVVNAEPAAAATLGLGSGRGLTGLRERLSAGGGTLRVGPVDGSGWSMRAHIPL